MMAIASNRRSSFGIRCVKCSDELIAPERSEFWNERRACHVWRCQKCNCCFETLVMFPAASRTKRDSITRDDNYLSLLVA